MTQPTVRWLRGVAVGLNVLVLARLVLTEIGMQLYPSMAIALFKMPSWQIAQLGLSLSAPILAIVALVWTTRTADSGMASNVPAES